MKKDQMGELNDWLKLNIDVIVDLARKYVPTEIIKEPTFEALAPLIDGEVCTSTRQRGGNRKKKSGA